MKAREILKMSEEEIYNYFKEQKIVDQIKDSYGKRIDVLIECPEKHIFAGLDNLFLFPLLDIKKIIKKSGVIYLNIDVVVVNREDTLDLEIKPIRLLICGPNRSIDITYIPQYKIKVIEGETSIAFQDND